MRLNFLKIAGVLMMLFSALSISGSMSIAIIILANPQVADEMGTTLFKLVLWPIVGGILSIAQGIIGLGLWRATERKRRMAIKFVIAYIVVMEAILYYVFRTDFILSYGYIGFLLLPAVYLLLLTFGRKQVLPR
ncbi:MAG: hypothetical protein BWY68_00745 [bacterium ADurb.Bin400]|nr:MAG: hypothetical protein BWY68_00745 [bacterium ADurb.Bin400]